jgi:hypothetical protein
MKSSNIFANLLLVVGIIAASSSGASAQDAGSRPTPPPPPVYVPPTDCGCSSRGGEGAAAGSVAVKLVNGIPTDVSSSIAVGKVNAGSSARTTHYDTYTSAFGSAGTLNMYNANNADASYAGGEDNYLGTAQANSLSSNGNINVTTGVASLP